MNAMMPETGKRRRSRIELTYYRSPDWLSRLRSWLCLVAAVVAVAWVAEAAIPGRSAPSGARSIEPSRLASKGPVAQPHAMWDATCDACHTPFTPINASRWAPSPWSGSPASDEKCQGCHAGPAHHQSQKKDEVAGCAECHRDHRGRDASLLAMDDSACTVCHRNLPAHRDTAAGPLRVAASVTSFDTDPEHHPDFTASVTKRATDPRRIKFNHALHLSPGLTLVAGGAPFTFAQLPAAARARYGRTEKQGADSPVHLACTACHELDVAEYSRQLDRRTANLLLPRPPGAYMLPVAYENHCAACHPLHFDAQLPDRTVRHGLAPKDVLEDLRQLYVGESVKADPALLRQFVPPRPLPGQAAARGAERLEQAVDDKVFTAAKLLFGAAVDEAARKQAQLPLGRRGCVECHNLKPGAQPLERPTALSSLEIEPVLMTTIWLKGAVFNHTAHRALGCLECHAGVEKSRENGDQLLLPGKALCVKCHGPAGTSAAAGQGGASAACTECHRYHDGDHPEAGLGAAARRGTAELSLERFLRGRPSLQEK